MILIDANLLLYAYHPRIEHGATLHTTDRDFARFPGLEWTDPLAAT